MRFLVVYHLEEKYITETFANIKTVDGDRLNPITDTHPIALDIFVTSLNLIDQ